MSNDIRVICKSCLELMHVPDTQRGKKIKCIFCGAPVTVPIESKKKTSLFSETCQESSRQEASIPPKPEPTKAVEKGKGSGADSSSKDSLQELPRKVRRHSISTLTRMPQIVPDSCTRKDPSIFSDIPSPVEKTEIEKKASGPSEEKSASFDPGTLQEFESKPKKETVRRVKRSSRPRLDKMVQMMPVIKKEILSSEMEPISSEQGEKDSRKAPGEVKPVRETKKLEIPVTQRATQGLPIVNSTSPQEEKAKVEITFADEAPSSRLSNQAIHGLPIVPPPTEKEKGKNEIMFADEFKREKVISLRKERRERGELQTEQRIPRQSRANRTMQSIPIQTRDVEVVPEIIQLPAKLDPDRRLVRSKKKWAMAKKAIKWGIFLGILGMLFFVWNVYRTQSEKDVQQLLFEYQSEEESWVHSLNHRLILRKVQEKDFALLHENYKSDQEKTRILVAQCLGRLESMKGFSILAAYLAKDSSPEVRNAAAEAMENMQKIEAIDLLIERLFKEEDLDVLGSIGRSLRKLTGETGKSVNRDYWKTWWKENREGFFFVKKISDR